MRWNNVYRIEFVYSTHDPNINKMVSAVLILLLVHINVDVTLWYVKYA